MGAAEDIGQMGMKMMDQVEAEFGSDAEVGMIGIVMSVKHHPAPGHEAVAMTLNFKDAAGREIEAVGLLDYAKWKILSDLNERPVR